MNSSFANEYCHVCGGTDFHNEAGFFYCNECQTQIQNVREQVVSAVYDENVPQLLTKKKVKKTNKNANKITSWETYNYIMAGLTNELISLGATYNFKDITYELWIRYLNKLQYLSKNPSIQPKIGAIYRQQDAEIIYNRVRKKRKRKNVLADEDMSVVMSQLDSRQKGRLFSKKKRALIVEDYNTIANSQNVEYSLQDQTLANLASSSDNTVDSGKIIYSKHARKELLKHMTRVHIEAHKNDVEGKLKCHQMRYTNLSTSFKKGPYILTKNKLYCILYLSLLLTSSNIQLSDMLRYCREGRLSFLEYRQFLPDTFTDKTIDQRLLLDGRKTLITSEYIREKTYGIYKLLKLRPCNFRPNLLELCRRYCTELNLPEQIYNIVGNLINETKPEMNIEEEKHCLPNYEGRVMAFILYIMKVLFGLDSVTEHEFTKFARQLNHHRISNNESNLLINEMFVWTDWVNYIEYRKIVLKNVHFPTKYLLDPKGVAKPDLFLNFFLQKKTEFVREPQTLSMELAKKMLEQLIEREDYGSENAAIDFPYSLTPFRTYIQCLQEKDNFEIDGYELQHEVLRDFSKHSIDFLINSEPYLNILNPNKGTVTKPGGANTNYKFMKMKQTGNTQMENDNWFEMFEKQKEEVLSLSILSSKLLNKQLEIVAEGLKFKPKTDALDINEMYCNKRLASVKDKIARDRTGKFCKLNSPDKKRDTNYKRQRHRGEWFLSSWTENPVASVHKYNPSLLHQVSLEEHIENPIEENLFNRKKRRRCDSTNSEEHSKKKHKCSSKSYKTHYVPRLDYWINFAHLTKMSSRRFEDMAATFPSSFHWLLIECSRIIEQSPKELFMEFVTVELYISYFHLNNTPIFNDVNQKLLKKCIRRAKKAW